MRCGLYDSGSVEAGEVIQWQEELRNLTNLKQIYTLYLEEVKARMHSVEERIKKHQEGLSHG